MHYSPPLAGRKAVSRRPTSRQPHRVTNIATASVEQVTSEVETATVTQSATVTSPPTNTGPGTAKGSSRHGSPVRDGLADAGVGRSPDWIDGPAPADHRQRRRPQAIARAPAPVTWVERR